MRKNQKNKQHINTDIEKKTQNLDDGGRERSPNSKAETGQSRPWGKSQS